MPYMTVYSGHGGIRREFQPDEDLDLRTDLAIAALNSKILSEYYRAQYDQLWSVLRAGRVPPNRIAFAFRTLDRLEQFAREALLTEIRKL